MLEDFIVLHMSEDNSPCVINVSQIEQIYKATKYDAIAIVFINNDDDMLVNESVERVYNIMYGLHKKTKHKEKDKEVLHD